MSTQMGIRELRDNLTTTIRRVRAGETIEITRHGQPVAVLSPTPARRRDRLGELIDRGEARPATQPLTPPARLLVNRSGIPTDRIIDEDRGD